MYLYLMACKRIGLTKIGISINPQRRLKTLNIRDKGIELLKTIKCKDAKKLERSLHRQFENQRVWQSELPTNEWFILDKIQVMLLCLSLGVRQ